MVLKYYRLTPDQLPSIDCPGAGVGTIKLMLQKTISLTLLTGGKTEEVRAEQMRGLQTSKTDLQIIKLNLRSLGESYT